MTIQPTPSPTFDATVPPKLPLHSHSERFSFTGSGLGYFKIWIVNLVLTIITLGIYSPWAKVRRLRYFYGHTKVGGRGFDFIANPKRILLGRLIAIALYLVLSIIGQFSVEMAVIGSLLIFAIMPWLVRSTLRFMARNSQYNNMSFSFRGSLAKAYGLMIVNILLTIISFGLFIPLAWWLYKRYQFNNTHFGTLKFNFNTSVWQMYRATIVPLLLLLFLGGGAMMLTFASLTGLELNEESSFWVTVGMLVVVYTVMLLVIPLMQAYVHQAIWGRLSLGDNRFSLVNFSPLKFAWINVTNYVAIVASLGLLYPWATVRMHRYKTETLALLMVDDFAMLTTPHENQVSSVAEEISDVFDFDVSW